MTRRDFIVKWAVYAVALLPVWFLERYILARVPVFGVQPMLLPLAVMAVAVLEGSVAGAGFGLAVGVLYDALALRGMGAMILGLTLLGLAAGIAAQYVLNQGFVGCLICSAVSLCLIDLVRSLIRLAQGVALPALLRVAVPEILWSLVFAWPVYLIFRWVHRRTQFSTLF